MKLTSQISDSKELDDFFSTNNNCKNVAIYKDECDLPTLYTGEEAEGFDVSTGNEWIYPTNLPIREYQRNIVSNALFKNTLVCLPTGLGKTFIAAVIMYNYHRWYPKNIIVFMAHSKPLVAQQVNACCTIMGIPPSAIAELNGSMLHSNRKKQWESKKIFFLTPQVFNNDLARGNVKPESIRCLVIDEAHKALGNQAYCQAVRSIKPFNSNFRVLALSATPGDDMNMVKEVIQNLMISHLELRNEEDPDIKPYLHEKVIETVVVKLDQKILEVKERFLRAVDKYVKPLIKNKILPQSFSAVNPFSLVLKQRQFIQDPNVGPELRGLMLSNFSVSISLFHALEELTVHGLRSFVSKLKCLQTGEGSTNKAHYRIANDEDIRSLIEHVEDYLGPDQNVSFDPNSSLTRLFDEIDAIDPNIKTVYSHPKFAALEQIIQKHFKERSGSTKVIVFCKSRQCTGEICNFLARFKPLVKPMIFIGQSQTSSGIVAKGFNQSVQLSVMKKFREGVYNTLIATCVAEEGLDIGEVDLIVNFDSGKNSNTRVQRSGRTGRKRNGRVVNLVTEGKEHQNYNISVSKGKRMNKRLASNTDALPFYADNPRLVPRHLHPVCHEMFFTCKNEGGEGKKEKKTSRKKKANDRSSRGLSPTCKKSKENIENITEMFDKSELVWSAVKAAISSDRGTLKTLDNVVHVNGETEKGRARGGGGGVEANPTVCMEVDSKDVDEDVVIIEDTRTTLLHLEKRPRDEYEDKPWELISGDEMDDEEKSLLTSFFKSFRTKQKPVVKFTELLRPFVCNNAAKSLTTGTESNLISNLKNFKNRFLDTETLVEVTVDELRDRVRESRKRLSSTFVAPDASNTSHRKLNFDEDIDFEKFLDSMAGDVPLSKGNIVSSTPLRDLRVPSTVEKGNSKNFEFLVPDDFFDSTRENATTAKASASMNKTHGSSFVSVSQVLDMVEKLGTDDTKNDRERSESPSSPILFVSQKVRSRGRSQAVPQSQRSGGTKSSRKCLKFDSIAAQETPRPESYMFTGSDDLFAEAEMALQKELEKAEESEVEKVNVSDGDTVEYDVAAAVEKSSAPEVIFECEKDTEKKVDESKAGDETPSTSFRDSARKPKTAVVRPFGFEKSTPAEEGSLLGKKTTETKSKEFSFACDFSLFDDDDFIEALPDAKKEEAPGGSGNVKGLANSSRSDVFGEKSRPKSCKKSKEREEEPEVVGDFPDDDGVFSDGALEAIKAVEEYERNAKRVESVAELSSEDSDEFFVPVKRKDASGKVKTTTGDEFFVPVKRKDVSGKGKATTAVEEKAEPAKKQRPRKGGDQVGRRSGREFIEAEADISGVGPCSSDEENTSGLDDYDSSFVDEREVLTQAPDVDMTAKYLQSTKSPLVARPGKFKMPSAKVRKDDSVQVFSQIPMDHESDYELDSFCVRGDDEDEECIAEDKNPEISELELAEILLEGKKGREKRSKRRRSEGSEGCAREGKSKKKRTFRRVQRIESDSSSESDGKEAVGKSFETKPCKGGRDESTCSEEGSSKFFSSISEVKSEGDSEKTVVFIASRQIASAPEITTALRAKWNVTVHVRSTPEADYIVGWRVGINRIMLSDFASGSSASRSSLKESVHRLTSNFREPVIIVEDDKNKGLPLTTGTGRVLWAKHSYRTLSRLVQSGVKLVFSRGKDDTARIIVLLSMEEARKGQNIRLNAAQAQGSEMEGRLKFFSSLPGVNVANAMRLCHKFPSVASFVSNVNSVNQIMRELCLKRDAATDIYRLLFNIPES